MRMSRTVKPGAWKVFLGGVEVGSATSRKVAINQVERPYRSGSAQVINVNTGEAWALPRGIWFKTLEAAGKRHEALAPAEGDG